MYTRPVLDLLVIDNNPSVREIINLLAVNYGISVKFVKDTIEFMKIFEKFEFRFVLCDLSISHSHQGLFILKMYNILKKGFYTKGQIYAFSENDLNFYKLLAEGFDGYICKDYNSISTFLSNIVTYPEFDHGSTDICMQGTQVPV